MMGTQKANSLSACVNGNAIAEMLEERAEMKRENASNAAYCGAGARKWAERLAKMSYDDQHTAKRIRELVAEINRLRDFEHPTT